MLTDNILDRMRTYDSDHCWQYEMRLNNLEDDLKLLPKKHKYVYILGRTKKETNRLRNTFLQKTKTYPYPKER